MACGVAPKPIAAAATMTTPSTANTYASGNHFSAQAAERSAARAIQPSCTTVDVFIAPPSPIIRWEGFWALATALSVA